jgi:peroxiredoxin Q/BCP
VVLVFYPGDDTPGCTKQLCQLRDNWGDALTQGIAVFGVNPANAEKHVKFRGKFNFPFRCLWIRDRKWRRCIAPMALL